MRVVSLVSACVLSAALGGCALFADPNAWPQKFQYGDSVNIATGPNIRFINDRPRDIPGRGTQMTMCNEPSPDVAVAFGTSLAAQATVNGQGSGSLNAGTSEEALALAGRTASVLALRDGLYAACQAYSNGALGQSAYALSLSQYGNLLVALTAHDPGATGGQTVTASVTSTASTKNNTTTGSTTPAAKTSSATPAAKKNSAQNRATSDRVSAGRPAVKDKSSALDYAATHYASLDPVIYATDAPGGASPALAKTPGVRAGRLSGAAHVAANPPADNNKPPADNNKGADTTPPPGTTTTTTTNSVTPAPPAAPTSNTTTTTTTMTPPATAPTKPASQTPKASTNTNTNTQIFTPSESMAAALLVACISEYDPTRLGGAYPNPVLNLDFCRKYVGGVVNRLNKAPIR
jgi:hypothetical protein